MKYRAYERYKKLRNRWLAEIPEHWVESKIKYEAPFQVGWTPSTSKDENFEGNNLWANISDLKKKYISNTLKKISNAAAHKASMKLIPAGSLLYSFKLSVGAISFCDVDMYTNEAIASFLPQSKNNLKYFYYSFSDYIVKNAAENIYGAKILNQELIKNAFIALPAFIEQVRIANFLDKETAKIDTLIEKQQQLIKLLKEKRQAVISHAVTKGLNPDVKMKASGVEWLGEVPAHWKVVQIKRLSPVKRGASPRPIDDPIYFDDNGIYAWVRISDVTASRTFLYRTEQKLSELGASHSVKLEIDKLFLSIAGSVGKACITKIKACIHDGFVYFPNFKENQKFLYYIFEAGQAYLGLGKFGTQLNLNTDTVGWIKIGNPSIKEQEEIVIYLDCKTAKIDNLIQKSRQAIKLLKERRAALISAAVTGKIDVRNITHKTKGVCYA